MTSPLLHRPSRRELVRVARFVVVGVIGTALDVGLVTTARHQWHWPLLLAVMLGFTANVSSGFTLNRWLVFADGTAPLGAATGRYVALAVVNAVVGIFGVTLAVASVGHYLVVRVLSSVVLVSLNFVVARTWVYRVPGAAATQ